MARGAATAAVVGLIGLGLAGCGAGQDSQTAQTRPSISGVDVNAPDQSVGVRNAAIVFPGPEGYGAGDAAPIQMVVVNQTGEPVRLVEARSAAGESVTIGEAAATPTAPASPTAPAAASPAPPAGGPGVAIPPSGYAPVTVVINGLGAALDSIAMAPLVLAFDNGVTLEFQVPMAVPLEPVPQTETPNPAFTEHTNM